MSTITKHVFNAAENPSFDESQLKLVRQSTYKWAVYYTEEALMRTQLGAPSPAPIEQPLIVQSEPTPKPVLSIVPPLVEQKAPVEPATEQPLTEESARAAVYSAINGSSHEAAA